MLLCTTAFLAIACIASSDALGLPKRMLSSILSENKNAFCGTYPMASRSSERVYSFKSCPSISIAPCEGSYSRKMASNRVDLPDPIFPIIPNVFPEGMLKLTLSSALMPVSG